MIKEFKAFLLRGNVIDLAVGIIVGAAFGKVVSSLVNDIILPPIGLIINNVDFKDLKLIIGGTAETPIAFAYGAFIQAIMEFLIIAAAVFLLIKLMQSIRKKDEDVPLKPTLPTNEEVLLKEIRDLLRETKK